MTGELPATELKKHLLSDPTKDSEAQKAQQQPEKKTEKEAETTPHNREKLPAEKRFDKAVYGGISYAAQAGTGILLTYWLKNGSGRKYYDKATRWLGSKLYPSLPIEEAAKEASTPFMVSTMIMVGNTFLFPVKWLENRKAKIVRSWHEKECERMEARGTPYTPEERAHQEKCLNDLEKDPPQTWRSLLGGRFFGLAAVYAAVFLIGNKRNEAAEAYSAKVITGGLDKIGLKTLAKSETLNKFIHVGFLDVFYSMVSAGGLYVYSHILKPPKADKHGKKEPLPDIIIGPTPATPALNALEERPEPAEDTPKRLFSDSIHTSKPVISKDNPAEKPKIQPRAKITKAPEEYGQKVTAEKLAYDETKLDRAAL